MGNSSLSTITDNVKQKAMNYLQFERKNEVIDFEQDESQELLIYGFIRDINTFIPLSLIDLCFKYYQEYHPNIFILTGTIKGDAFNKIHCINLNNSQKYTFNIYDILQNEGERDKNNIITSYEKDWDSWYGNISFCREFQLPNYIHKLYLKHNNNNNERYSVLFKCGGSRIYNNNYNASIIVFNEKSLNKYKYDEIKDHENIYKTTEIDGFEYKLPALNVNKICRSIWSFEHQSLFTMCCDGIISQLQLKFEFEWKHLPQSIINNKSIEPMTILQNKQLCLLSNNSVQLFDFNHKKWNKISNGFINHQNNNNSSSLLYSGIFYNKIHENIFIGGGLQEYKQRYFNLNKIRWYNLCDTNYKHSQYPILWSSKNQPFLLFIAGNNDQDIGVVEFYDLRSNVNKWNNANHNMQFYTYFNLNINARIRHILSV